MKVIVNTFLNVRVGKPSVNAPCYQYLAPGSELEVEDKLYKGDPFEGSDQWYRDMANNYYWAGGVYKTRALTADEKAPFANNYLQILRFLPQACFNSGGKDCTIAVIDDGTWLDSDYLPKIRNIDLTNNYNPSRRHGTFIAGILGGKQDIVGVTDSASLFFIKYKDMPTPEAALDTLNQALDRLLGEPGDKRKLIVNISQTYTYSEVENLPVIAAINNNLRQLTAAGAKVYAAAGDNEELLTEKYPACRPEVVAVGCVSTTFAAVNLNKISATVNIVSPFVDYRSFANADFDTRQEPGSSFATALLSGMAALVTAGGGNMEQELRNNMVPVSSFANQLINRFQYYIIH